MTAFPFEYDLKERRNNFYENLEACTNKDRLLIARDFLVCSQDFLHMRDLFLAQKLSSILFLGSKKLEN